MTDLCVVFDIDDTLYLERDYVVSGFAAVGKWAGDWLGIPDFERRCMAAHESGLQGSIFDAALISAGTTPLPEVVTAMVSIYRTHVPSIRLLEDAARVLEGLSGKCRMAAISDGPAVSQSRKAEALGLGRYASTIVLTEVFGKACSKPSPFAFRKVESETKARRYVYVADNPLKDFQSPRELGWTTIRIRRAGGLHFAKPNLAVIPDYEFPDCSGLLEVFSSLPIKTGAVA